MKTYPPQGFRMFSNSIALSSTPQTTEEFAYLYERGIRRYFLIDTPLTPDIRQAGAAYKLEIHQWNLASLRNNPEQMWDLTAELESRDDKGSNVLIVGDIQDLGLICAALAMKVDKLPLVFAVRKVMEISGPESLTNETLVALDKFDKHIQ